MTDQRARAALSLLDLHYESFYAAESYASKTGHPVPTDTRGWSQILVSTLCGIRGLERKKGPDLKDGSDVKGANTWKAIDTPRFNGVIKAGTLASTSGQLASLDAMPNLYLVLWDETKRKTARCRIWVVRPRSDQVFRAICTEWYAKRGKGEIKSNNFQLHPPRGQDTDIIRNTCGNLSYPLYFSAERTRAKRYTLLRYDPKALITGTCSNPTQPASNPDGK
jgi:hypothetical protein